MELLCAASLLAKVFGREFSSWIGLHLAALLAALLFFRHRAVAVRKCSFLFALKTGKSLTACWPMLLQYLHGTWGQFLGAWPTVWQLLHGTIGQLAIGWPDTPQQVQSRHRYLGASSTLAASA